MLMWLPPVRTEGVKMYFLKVEINLKLGKKNSTMANYLTSLIDFISIRFQ